MKDLVEEVKKIIKDNFWLVLATADENNQPHSSVVVYQSDGDILYVQTGIDTLKARDIKRNNKVSVTIPFRKNFLHKLLPAPPAELHFSAKAEILPYEDEGARKVYKKFLKIEQEVDEKQENIWIKITPSLKITTYGLGVKLLDMRKPEKACKIIEIK